MFGSGAGELSFWYLRIARMLGVTAQISIASPPEQLVGQLRRGHLLKFFATSSAAGPPSFRYTRFGSRSIDKSLTLSVPLSLHHARHAAPLLERPVRCNCLAATQNANNAALG